MCREWGMSRPGPEIPPLSSQRSRIVLECAEGHSVMEVSRRLRIAPESAPGAALLRARPGRAGRRATAGYPTEDHGRGCRAGDRQDARREAEERDALVDPVDGRGHGHGHVAVDGLMDLAAFALAPHRSHTFKLSDGPAVNRQGPRRRRALPRPAGEGPWSSAWTRSRRSRPWTGPSRSCR